MDTNLIIMVLIGIGCVATLVCMGAIAKLFSLKSAHALAMQSLQAELNTVASALTASEVKNTEYEQQIVSLQQSEAALAQANIVIAARKAEFEATEKNLFTAMEELSVAKAKIAQQEVSLTEFARVEKALQLQLETNTDLQASVKTKESRIESLIAELREQEQKASKLRTQLEKQAEHNEQVVRDLKDTKALMLQEFKALASDVLEQKGKDFRSQHQESLEKILSPFKSEIGEFKRQVEASQKEELVHRSKLGEELKQLRLLNQKITDDADNLTKALKGEKKLQGNWGEIQLERILESSGLVKGQEYEREANFKTEEGKNQRPDFIVKLPEGKHLIIDSKVSLNAFLNYCQAETVEAQELSLKQHVGAMKQHVRTLNEKDYPSLTGLQSPDFVFMFVPIEPAFNVALQADFGMFEEAFAKHIVIVTPTTLLATLKTVASIWTIEKQNKKAAELAERAGHVYDKLRGFLEKMEKLGGQLHAARDSYDDAMKTLRTGSGNLVRQAEQFKALGVRVKKDIPEVILAKSDIADSLTMESDVES
ncbi:DNA recombination protein RmuC [Alteromonas sp. C1M14]|uniref:DNA recombination protein RmuC n=1 Tax=Alteromonas sp. C1M14 TaxID=2841567 RepID=UPI001C0887A9|nr:DNA recombination protein RmuC [Alteromonas sp. C1M14]